MSLVEHPRDPWMCAEALCHRLAGAQPDSCARYVAVELECLLSDVRLLSSGSTAVPARELGHRALQEMERLFELGAEVGRACLAHEQKATVLKVLVVVRAVLQALVDAAREGWSAVEIRETLDTTAGLLLHLVGHYERPVAGGDAWAAAAPAPRLIARNLPLGRPDRLPPRRPAHRPSDPRRADSTR